MFTTSRRAPAAVLLALGVLGASADLLAPAVRAEQPAAQAAPKPVAPIAPDRFGPLMQLILPAAERGETKWLEAPWMTDTLEARKKAAAEDKPIVVWTMSACPLGGD
jgi:hypothetical protein